MTTAGEERREETDFDSWLSMSWHPIDFPWTLDWWAEHTITDLVYHYTSSEGLVGILQSGCLWATDSQYLNDASEMQYATEVIHNALASLTPDWSGPGLSEFLDHVRLRWYGSGDVSIYVACFCVDRDLLSQWRAYANVTGYSIGFDPTGWTQHGSPLAAEASPQLAKVFYRPERQAEIVRDFMQRMRTVFEEGLERFGLERMVKRGLPPMSSYSLSVLRTIMPCFKHPAFESEQEWRLIHVQSRTRLARDAYTLDVKFRTSSMGIAPYVELAMAAATDVASTLLPIKEVWHGPSRHPQQTRNALRMVLAKYGYTEAADSVYGSEVPLRT